MRGHRPRTVPQLEFQMKTKILYVLLLLGCFAYGCSPSEAPTASGSAADQQNATAEPSPVDQLVLMNRMLSSEEFGVLGAYGHVSIRSQADPNKFLIARAVAPGLV